MSRPDVKEVSTSEIERDIKTIVQAAEPKLAVWLRFMPDTEVDSATITARSVYRPPDRINHPLRIFRVQIAYRSKKIVTDIADAIDYVLTRHPWSTSPSRIDSINWKSMGDTGRDKNNVDTITYNYEVIALATEPADVIDLPDTPSSQGE